MIAVLLALAVPTKVAVVVGANAGAPGYASLRYAYNDADRMAETLQRVGEFARDDIVVLHDPEPQALLSAFERVAARIQARGAAESLLFFYYSGHADAQSVFPRGQALALADVRTALDNVHSTVRVGVIDACRGGGWTQAKGLSASAPFAVTLPQQLLSEGSALIAASSGLENAHESEALAGSFFTHHFTAGLLGAADGHHDGHITLSEAFDYAKERTIRDTAQVASEPQHPSFDINLHGRQDLVLAEVQSSPSTMEVQQDEGPLDIVHLGSGLRILELPAGKTALTLALPPGKYLVRRERAGHIYASEVDVRPGAVEHVRESDLKIVGTGMLAFKGLEEPPPRVDETTTLKHHYDLKIAMGWASEVTNARVGSVWSATPNVGLQAANFLFLINGSFGITDRWEWLFPGALAYRFGQRGRLEVVAHGGLLGVGWDAVHGNLTGNVEAGADARLWLSHTRSIVFAADTTSGFAAPTSRRTSTVDGPVIAPADYFSTWRATTSVGTTYTLRNLVTFAVGLGFSTDLAESPQLRSLGLKGQPVLSLGAVQSLGLRPLPLVSIAITRVFNLDFYGRLSWDLAHGNTNAAALAGTTFTF